MPLVPLFQKPLGRLRVEPLDPQAIPTGARPRDASGRTSRRPHADAKVAEVRHLIEKTTLTYGEIARRTGVGRASICRWTRDHAWVRDVFAPRATDTLPTARAGQKMKLRLLAERLRKLAERHVLELEQSAAIDADKLMQALQLLKMARLEAMGRRRRRKYFDAPAQTGQQMIYEQDALRTAIREMRRGGVNVDAAPDEAIDLVLDAYRPPDGPALRGRGRR